MRQSGVKHISCFYNSRRLDESWPHILDVANARRRTSRNLTLEDCEGDDELFGVMKTMLQSNASFFSMSQQIFGRCFMVVVSGEHTRRCSKVS